jgi:hypothetical protein
MQYDKVAYVETLILGSIIPEKLFGWSEIEADVERYPTKQAI